MLRLNKLINMSSEIIVTVFALGMLVGALLASFSLWIYLEVYDRVKLRKKKRKINNLGNWTEDVTESDLM